MDDNGGLKRAISRVCERRDQLRMIAGGRCPECQSELTWENRPWLEHGPQWSCLCGLHGWLDSVPLLSIRHPRALVLVDSGDDVTGQADLWAILTMANADGGTAEAATASRVLWQYQHNAELVAARKAIGA